MTNEEVLKRIKHLLYPRRVLGIWRNENVFTTITSLYWAPEKYLIYTHHLKGKDLYLTHFEWLSKLELDEIV